MRIGQIVFINDKNLPNVQTGIITRTEQDFISEIVWHEVLCNDGQNHVLPAFLLSPARGALKGDWAKLKKYYKNNATLYKTHKNPVTLYT